MPIQFSVAYDVGFTIYGLALDSFERAWNGTTFVDPAGVRPTCDIPMVYDAPSGTYIGDIPSTLPPGTYTAIAYLQGGGTPDDPDPPVGIGTVTVPVASAGTGFEAALVARLKADTALSAIVGARIYPDAIPQKGSLPCLVYAIPSTARARNLRGAAGIATARVLIDARAKTYAVLNSIQEVLRQYDGFSGTLAGDVVVENTRMDDRGDEYEWPGGTGTDQGTYHMVLTFYFKYRESLPVLAP
jgi:hypothetical protein